VKRRELIAALGGAAAWPVAARAQLRTMRVVGFLHTSVSVEDLRSSFAQGLSEAGFIEGQNLAIIFRFAEGRPERLMPLAGDLV